MRRTDCTPGSSRRRLALRPRAAGVLLVPVEDPADERRDQLRPRLGAGDRLGEQKSSVRLQWMPSFSSTSAALMPSHVEASLIRMRSRSMPAPRRADQLAALGDRCLGVEREARIHFGRHAARHDLQDLQAEGDQQLVDDRADRLRRVRLARSCRAAAV